MPNPVRPSLDAAEVWDALATLALRPTSGDPRAALVSALALRHTELPRATPNGGARVLPFPGGRRRAAAPGSGAAAVVPLASSRRPEATPASIRLVPAPGAVPGLDEGPARLTVFRSLDAGRLLGREVTAGARVVVSRREAGPMDLAVYATRRTIGLCPAGGPPAGGRILGTVEAVIR